MRMTCLVVTFFILSGCTLLLKKAEQGDPFVEACRKINKPIDSYRGVKSIWSGLYSKYGKGRYENKRKLIVFMDGTGNNESSNTNIWKLYKASLRYACSGDNPVIPYYDKGVGAKRHDRFRGGATGFGASLNIRQAYRFLVETYNPGDKIFIFGFSRGAFTARSLNGMLEYVGLLDINHVPPKEWFHSPYRTPLHRYVKDLYKAYRIRHDGTPVFLTKKLAKSISDAKLKLRTTKITHAVTVSAIGVFDTVPALGITAKSEPDNHRLDLYATKGFHALSLDEQRRPFSLLRFNNIKLKDGQILREVWFPGVHSNVGGGYGEVEGLSKLAYDWMVREFGDYQIFPMSEMLSSCEAKKAACEAGQLKDEFHDTPSWKKAGLKRRWPRNNDWLHNSIYCRKEILPLIPHHKQREPNRRYEILNLKEKENYEIENYNCARLNEKFEAQ